MRKQKAQKSEPVLDLNPEQLQLLDIEDLIRLLKIGRTTIYDLIRTDGLPTIKLGNSTRFSAVSLQKWIAAREQAF